MLLFRMFIGVLFTTMIPSYFSAAHQDVREADRTAVAVLEEVAGEAYLSFQYVRNLTTGEPSAVEYSEDLSNWKPEMTVEVGSWALSAEEELVTTRATIPIRTQATQFLRTVMRTPSGPYDQLLTGNFEKAVFNGVLPFQFSSPEIELDTQYPILIFLHGAGERGNDNEAQLFHIPTSSNPAYFETIDTFFIAPQFPSILKTPLSRINENRHYLEI